MYAIITISVVLFFAGMIFQKEVFVTGAASVTRQHNSLAANNASAVLAYGDACVIAAQNEPLTFAGQIPNVQIVSSSFYALPGASFMTNWACEVQSGASGTRFVSAVFSGVTAGTLGRTEADSSDMTWWAVSSSSGSSPATITKAANLATGAVTTITPSIVISTPSAGVGTLLRWEIIS